MSANLQIVRKDQSGIYAIQNRVNRKIYVGSAVRLAYRWNGHRQALKRGVHDNKHLQSAWKKYHPWNFEFKILIYCAKEYLLLWEQIAIDGHIATIGWDQMYNQSPTAGSNFGIKWSDEVRAKMSLARRGEKKAPRTEEHRRNLSLANLGKTLSPERLAKLKLVNLGKKLSKATKDKMSVAKKGKPLTEEHKINLRGKKRSEETCRKISTALKGKKRTLEQNLANSARNKGRNLGRKDSEQTKANKRAAWVIRKAKKEGGTI